MLSKKEIYAQAMRELERRRQQSSQTQHNHMLEAVSLSPEIGRLRRELGKTSIKLSKALLAGEGNPQELFEQIKEENLRTQERIHLLLDRLGLPHDYLSHKPVCSKCNDYGYIGQKQCSCLKKLLHKIAIADLQESSQLTLSSFDTFDLGYYSRQYSEEGHVVPYEHMSRLFHYCVSYANSFSPSSQGIFMTGKTGLGKTHLSLAIAAKAIDQGYNVIYSSVSDIVRRVSGQYFGRKQEGNDVLELVTKTDLLILDDLGAEFESSFSTSAVYDVINSRIAAGRPTIINTNLTPGELEKRYSERIVSRLYAQLVPLHFVGQDVRMLKAEGQPSK
ncbi:MAG: ATP-binding protein [Massilioclostridium sp.]|nr:ATP-binding protein [Massilioclostridium sp.]